MGQAVFAGGVCRGLGDLGDHALLGIELHGSVAGQQHGPGLPWVDEESQTPDCARSKGFHLARSDTRVRSQGSVLLLLTRVGLLFLGGQQRHLRFAQLF